MWQMDNLRRAIQEAENTESAAGSSSNGVAVMDAQPGSNGAYPPASGNGVAGQSSDYPSGNGSHPPSSQNGSYEDTHPDGASGEMGPPVAALASRNGARPMGSLTGAEPGASGRSTQGRDSWQTRGLFRDEDPDERKGAGLESGGPSMNGASMNGADPSMNGASEHGWDPSLNGADSRQEQAGSAPSPSKASASAAASVDAVPARPGASRLGADGEAPGGGSRRSGLQQRQSSASQQLAWDSADQEFDDAATVMNFLR